MKLIAPVVVLVSSLQFHASSAQAQCTGTWTQRMPAAMPSSRDVHAMAYDTARGVTVLFGGIAAGGINGETWEWNGTIWTKRTSVASPPARFSHTMSYDSARGVTVLFGGNFGGGSFTDDTWEWDGTNWTQRTPALLPSARRYHAMVYDSARGVTVLFGGDDGADDGETWEWDGTNWTQRDPAAAPPPRYEHKMAYDTSRGVTVLFGGSAGVAGLDDETWEWTGPKPAITQQPAALTVAPGQPAAFSITAGGPGPLTYRWRKDGAPLSDAGPIIGAATATLTINPTAVEDSGAYTCEVSNPCGATTSRAAALVVDACIAVDATGDCNANGRLDFCDIAADPALDADANGTLDSCDSAACGMCGAGVPMTMPLALAGLVAFRRRRTSPFIKGWVSP